MSEKDLSNACGHGKPLTESCPACFKLDHAEDRLRARLAAAEAERDALAVKLAEAMCVVEALANADIEGEDIDVLRAAKDAARALRTRP